MVPEPLVMLLLAAGGLLLVATVGIVAAVAVRGRRYRRSALPGTRIGRVGDESVGPSSPVASSMGVVASRDELDRQSHGLHPETEEDRAHRSWRFWDQQFNEVVGGSYAAASVNRAIRVLAWSFILIVLLIVGTSRLWQPVEAQIYLTLLLAAGCVLVAHEWLPGANPSQGRIVLETTVAIVFLTILVRLTGEATSPFFFLFPIFVAGAALVTSRPVAILLGLEALLAFLTIAVAGPLSGAPERDSLVRVAVNVTALILLLYAAIVIADIQRRTRDAAVRLSTLDALTDLNNRAFLFNAVDREIRRSRRFRRGFCLLMMDLDGLKSVNDRFGHFQGDLVLHSVGQSIKEALREIDVAARYGGDEFVALLPETDPSGAFVVAEKIRQLVSETVIDTSGRRIQTSLSIGVVAYPDDGQTADELMIAADQAMYSSKRMGKNRVVPYRRDMERASSEASGTLETSEASEAGPETGSLATTEESEVPAEVSAEVTAESRASSSRKSGKGTGGPMRVDRPDESRGAAPGSGFHIEPFGGTWPNEPGDRPEETPRSH